METKLKNLSLSIEQKYNLYFAISKAYEDLNDIGNCYKNLKIANSLKKDASNFNIKDEIKIFKNIKDNFSKIQNTNMLSNYSHEQKNNFLF